YLLAVALETEMSRLDDARVNRADRHLVNLFALDAVEVRDANQGRLARLPAPGVLSGTIRSVKTDRLEPGMAFRVNARLLGDLPLEEMNLRAIGRQRSEPVRFQRRAGDTQLAPRAIGQHRIQIDFVGRAWGVGEKGRDSQPPRSDAQDVPTEVDE